MVRGVEVERVFLPGVKKLVVTFVVGKKGRIDGLFLVLGQRILYDLNSWFSFRFVYIHEMACTWSSISHD